MSATLIVRNRCRSQMRLDIRLLRWITRFTLTDLLEVQDYELGVYVVGATRMTQLNEKFLQHAGSTDAITFDYSDPLLPGLLCGEIYVCLDEAESQAQRFRTTWQSELVRYVVHGILHLRGYDDTTLVKRKQMKTLENQLVRQIKKQFYLPKLGGHVRNASKVLPAIPLRAS